MPIAGINLNAGCPSPLVNRHGAGAELLRNLTALQDCLQGLRRVVPEGMFSVKCRTGWADAAENGNEDALYVSELIWEPEDIIEED